MEDRHDLEEKVTGSDYDFPVDQPTQGEKIERCPGFFRGTEGDAVEASAVFSIHFSGPSFARSEDGPKK